MAKEYPADLFVEGETPLQREIRRMLYDYEGKRFDEASTSAILSCERMARDKVLLNWAKDNPHLLEAILDGREIMVVPPVTALIERT